MNPGITGIAGEAESEAVGEAACPCAGTASAGDVRVDGRGMGVVRSRGGLPGMVAVLAVDVGNGDGGLLVVNGVAGLRLRARLATLQALEQSGISPGLPMERANGSLSVSIDLRLGGLVQANPVITPWDSQVVDPALPGVKGSVTRRVRPESAKRVLVQWLVVMPVDGVLGSSRLGSSSKTCTLVWLLSR